MLINRYNYEEFFLLYADGELMPLEVEIVDQFVKVHPDLKEELDMLMDCRLVADMPVFYPKEKLYKQTVWDEENITETQSQLLLLLDNELPATDKAILQRDIAENPVLELEWNTLQQTKLLAETIAHPNKEPLYQQKRIPKIMWWRWAAAAALILGSGWFFVGKNLGGNNTGKLATVTKINAVPAAKPVPSSSIVPTNNEVAVDEQSEEHNSDMPEENTVAVTNKNVEPVKKAIVNNSVDKEDAADNDQQDAVESTLAQTDNADNNDERVTLINHKNLSTIDDASHAKPQKAPAKFIGSTKNNLIVQNKNSQSDNLSALQTNADDDEYVHIAGARVKKQKLRGMFRNITRGIGRTFSNSKVEAATPMAVNN